MDFAVLVAHGIPRGFELIDALVRHGVDLDAAFWTEVGEEEGWRLHLATDVVVTQGSFEAYRQVYAVLNSMAEPKIGVNDVKLIDSYDPLARVVKEFQQRFGVHHARWTGFIREKGIAIDDAYVYPLPQVATAP
jgi:hypothetical protein